MPSPSHETEVLQLHLAEAPTILLGASEGSPRAVRHEAGTILSFLARGGAVSLASAPEGSSFSVAWEGSCLRLLARTPVEINGRPVQPGERRVVFAGDRISASGASLQVTVGDDDSSQLFQTSVGADPEATELRAEVAQARRDPARHLDRYLLLNELGRGGFGAVYRAYDPKLERVVAIKILLRMSGHAKKRFEREAKVTAGFQHPNIVRLLDRGSHRGLPYLVMEFVPGRSLEGHANAVLLRLPPADRARQTITLLTQVADALVHAHGAGVLHRDLKPANILVAQDGTPYVVDFGLAREEQSDERLTLTGTTLGTPLFMPLEQLVGEPIDARADVYALGATFYMLLTGTPPRAASSAAEMFEAHRHPAPPPSRLVPELPAACDRIAERSLASAPADRYPDMAAMADDLRAAQVELDRSTGRTAAWAIGGAALTVGLGLLVYAVQLQPGIDPTPAATTQSAIPTPDVAASRTLPSPPEADRAAALIARARRDLARGRVRQAIADLEQATELSEALEPARLLARARVERGSWAQVEAAASEVARRGDPAEAHRVRIALAIRTKKVDEAHEHVSRLMALPDRPLDDRVLQARVTLLRGKGKETMALLDAILRSDPDHVPALLLSAQLFLAAKRLKQTQQVLARINRLAPRDAVCLALRAQLLMARGKHAEAVPRILRALEEGPADQRVWEVVDLMRKRRELIEPLLRRGIDPLIARAPDLPYPRLARFLMHVDLRRPMRTAIRDLDAIIGRDQTMVPRALYLRGMTYLQTGTDPRRGRADLERFLRLAPRSPSADHARRVLVQ